MQVESNMFMTLIDKICMFYITPQSRYFDTKQYVFLKNESSFISVFMLPYIILI